MSLTIANLKAFVRAQSKRDYNNYIGAYESWERETLSIKTQRCRVYRKFKSRWMNADETLVPGNYGPTGRLRITDNGIDYVPGQYAPVEIWDMVYEYLEATN